jgi:S-formylglutathione hydrolase FrmB
MAKESTLSTAAAAHDNERFAAVNVKGNVIKYRTISDRKHRAIAGFSMGGGQAGRFGLRHLETFSHVGIMSAGMAGGPDTEPLVTLAANPAKANNAPVTIRMVPIRSPLLGCTVSDCRAKVNSAGVAGGTRAKQSSCGPQPKRLRSLKWKSWRTRSSSACQNAFATCARA